MTLPCIGAGILVVDPGPNTNVVYTKRQDGRPVMPKKRRSSRASWHDSPPRLLKAYVTHAGGGDVGGGLGVQIIWKCGIREGSVFEGSEGTTWTHGHGPEARKALLAARAMR